MSVRTIERGTTEYLSVEVTADVDLVAQVVALSFDKVTWIPAAWVGDEASVVDGQFVRSAQALLEDDDLPGTGNKNVNVYVRVTDFPEIPVMRAGELRIR